MIFLVEYNRRKGELVQFTAFKEDFKAAEDARLQLELKLLGSGVGHEVVLLEAKNQEILRRTHRRYFETLMELAASGA